ncbi:malonyl-CoA:anthocyanidin 5-O-glucoside-6''-O-malonyltransferase-like [Hibiscus syriacus]|uniref:Malonyl-CoA:anthocyanidin 5-O-glucoside-6''-O-malonyltransferase-like n=1 Tax=Hibiscus syriacus TaxID=106335 RepID=A0A6A3BUR8_HIBSY|nr:nuclear transport factor 2-like [Hibiscus syriacus]XP_039064588.1 nuclear transport factor 2-like [Hibiscus syriacus]KAE8720404.1 malonyl-CoA:anthocyanidin 5-O-glucoside-6''-O-malonyltransferase-like [Hibiscus syriacus]
MALETVARPATPSAQVVGNAFVEQYYHILYNSPDLAHRFYHDSSVISRPDSNGVMTSVTTMQGINEKILSVDYTNHKAEINTADAQKSYMEGVTVLVTGCLTGKDNLKRKFAQSFFLAPQDNGYFVLNDVFRYVGDGEPLGKHKVNGVNDAPRVPPTPEPEPTQIPDPPAPVEENQNVAEQVHEPSDPEKQLVNEKMPDVKSHSHSNSDDIPAVVESASPSAQDDSVKKSYASIVKVAKGSPGPTRVYVPSNTTEVTPKKTEKQPPVSAVSAPPEATAPSSDDALESNNIPEEVEGHSIYIRNLPFNMTAAQLKQEFNKFGPIKQGGVQVRNNRQQGYCFGFVEFLSVSSMNDAIQASPITIGERHAVVEIKRTSTRVVNGRGSFPSRRGTFRNDSFRGRNYSGNQSFGRNEYGNQVEFSGRPRGGSAGRDGRGRGRGNHSSRPNQNLAST